MHDVTHCTDFVAIVLLVHSHWQGGCSGYHKHKDALGPLSQLWSAKSLPTQPEIKHVCAVSCDWHGKIHITIHQSSLSYHSNTSLHWLCYHCICPCCPLAMFTTCTHCTELRNVVLTFVRLFRSRKRNMFLVWCLACTFIGMWCCTCVETVVTCYISTTNHFRVLWLSRLLHSHSQGRRQCLDVFGMTWQWTSVPWQIARHLPLICVVQTFTQIIMLVAYVDFFHAYLSRTIWLCQCTVLSPSPTRNVTTLDTFCILICHSFLHLSRNVLPFKDNNVIPWHIETG